LSALLFVLHPIRTEGVASIVGRAECLSAFFIFIAWWAYVRGKKSRPGIWISVSVFSFILATLTKESAYAFILLLPLTDFASAEEGKSREAFSARRMAVFYAPYVAGLMLSLCLRYSVLGGFTPLYINPSSNPLVRANVVARLLTATFVFAKYLWLLICPAQLSADYSYDQIPLVEGLVSWRALLSLCVLGALLAGIALAARRARILLFCGLMFLLSFLIVSNWVRPIGTIMAERLLYFPSLGFTCALAYLLCVGLDRARQRLVSSIAAIVLIGAYALRTAQRNLDWRDHYSLFSSTARVSPKSYLAQGNYATILLYERNDVRGAIEHALKAARIRPDDPAAQFTLGEAYRRSGDLGRAAEAFSRVARLAPRTSGGLAALRSLAAIHQAHNEHAQAMETYRKILEWRPSDQEARKSLESLLSRAMEK
jgi:tetratricopeptide (TPR) repeat protein